MGDYRHPQALVSTVWVSQHVDDPKVRLMELHVDTASYNKGHTENAIGWDWQTQLQDNVPRDLLTQRQFEELCNKSAIAEDADALLHGANSKWFAAYAFWQFKYYGHRDVRLMNGRREKWDLEGPSFTTDVPKIAPTDHKASPSDAHIRARRELMFEALDRKHYYPAMFARRSIYWQSNCSPGNDGPARRAHSWCREHSVGGSCQ